MLNFKCAWIVSAVFTALAVLAAPASGVLMSQNFDSEFKPGVLNGASRISSGDYHVQDPAQSMEIVTGAASAPNALKVGRKGTVGYIAFRSNRSVPKGDNFRVSFKVKMPAGNSVAAFVGSRGHEQPLGAVSLIGGASPRAYNEKQNWVSSGLPVLPENEWVTVTMDFNAFARTYEVSVTYPNGKTVTSIPEYPFLCQANVTEVRFINGVPVGNYALIDDLVLESTGKGSAGASAANGVVLEQNFDSDFEVGELSGGGRCAGAKWMVNSAPNNYSIVDDPACSKPHALKIMRDGYNGFFALRPQVKIPEKRNYTVEFNGYAPASAGTVMFMFNGNGMVGALLMKASEAISGYNISSAWEKNNDLPAFPPEKWCKLQVKFNANQGYYTINLIEPDGTKHEGTIQHPCLVNGAVEEIRFINILPQKSFAFVDDIKIFYDDNISMEGRDNFAPNASSINADFAALLKGEKPYAVTGKTVEMEFSPPVKIAAVLFKAAPGMSLPKTVSLKALNAGGHWLTIGNNLAIDPKTGLVEFKELPQITKLSLTFGGATGAVLSSLGVYSPLGTPQGQLDRDWAQKLDAEYDLPVYDQQYEGCDVALLTFVNHTDKPLPVTIDMHDRLKDQHLRTFKYTIPAGTSNLKIDLKNIANGEYLTTITDASMDKGGKIIRLLRHCTSPACTAVPKKEMTGEKMFFPDGFFLADAKNIHFTTGVAKPHLVKRGSAADNDAWIVYGDNLGFDDFGNLVVNFHTLNRLWQTASRKNYHAVANPDDLDSWQVADGAESIHRGQSPMVSIEPPETKPNWSRKPGPDGKIKYRFYDPETDGPIKLNELNCEFIRPSAPGTVGYTDYDWGVMRPSPAHVWAVWYKAPGEALIIGRKPLVSGFPGPGNIEPPNSGSDLGFGQWLEDGGKTLCFGFGRHLIRYLPYQAEYDNMPDRNRIVGIWRTHDGINWEQGFIAPPDKTKPVADQSYGGHEVRLPHAAGLKIAIYQRYSAYTQQISWEIIYSWDGFRWTRFQREPQFLANGPLGDWTHCGGYLSDSSLVYNGKIYQLMTWVNDHYHFQSEIVHGSVNSVDHMTADYMRKRYSPRKLEKWPYFQKHFDGSWEKLAEHTRNASSSCGVLEYRLDGYFFAQAKDAEARMLTTPVVAANGLKMNAKIEDNGYIDIALLDAFGNVIPGYTKHLGAGDNVAFDIFDQLPAGEFQVELKLRNAEVYTLNF